MDNSVEKNKLDKMKELVSVLNEASNSYYRKNISIMTDFEYDKLYDEYEKLKIETQNNKVNEEVAISMDQISFDIVKDNNILDEIKNLDILSMTPLDAMNALFSLQKKVKNK